MLKLLNLSVLSYIFAALAIVLGFFVFLLRSRPLFWSCIGIVALLSSIVSFCMAGEPIGLLVMGIEMPLAGGAVAAYVLAGVFGAVAAVCAVMLFLDLWKRRKN